MHLECARQQGSELRDTLPRARGFPKQEVCIVRYDGVAIVPVELPATGEMIRVEFPVALLGF